MTEQNPEPTTAPASAGVSEADLAELAEHRAAKKKRDEEKAKQTEADLAELEQHRAEKKAREEKEAAERARPKAPAKKSDETSVTSATETKPKPKHNVSRWFSNRD